MDENILMGHRLRLLRKDKGLSLEEVCTAVNRLYGITLHKGTLSKWERGVEEPRLSFLRKLAMYYDESLDFISGITNISKHPKESSKAVM